MTKVTNMINIASKEKPVAPLPVRKQINPNQALWIEEKFGHLKPIIRANARIKDKSC